MLMTAHQRGAADDDVGQGAGCGNQSALACRLQRHRAERDRTHSWNEKYGEAMTDDLVNKIADCECNNRDRRDDAAGTDRHSTIVICEACTSKGLNSPDLPYLSVAVTLNRTIPVAVSCGTTHLATQNS